MADTLIQQDADALHGEGAPAAVGTPPQSVDVIPYNFRRPPRISRDRQMLLDAIFGRFALSLQTVLSTRLRRPTDMMVTSVEQATFAEFRMSLASPCAAFVFNLTDANSGSGVIDLGTDLAYYLIDRLFGGPGEADPLTRTPTPLERLVVKGVAEKMLKLLAEAWSEYMEFRPTEILFESTPEAMKVLSPEDNVLVASLEVRSGAFAGPLSLCIPLHALEEFLQERPAAAAPQHTATREERERGRQLVASTVRGAALSVTARFCACTLRMSELAALRPGIVIHTRHPVGAPVHVHVGGTSRFIATVGQIQRHIGLQITDTITESGVQATRAPQGQLL